MLTTLEVIYAIEVTLSAPTRGPHKSTDAVHLIVVTTFHRFIGASSVLGRKQRTKRATSPCNVGRMSYNIDNGTAIAKACPATL